MTNARRTKAGKSGAVGIDEKNGYWRYRFKIAGQPRVSVETGLEAIRENLGVAQKLREEHRSRLLKGEPEPIKELSFSEAADRFLQHKDAKHRDKPSTARRIRVSFASWRVFMDERALSTWTRGDVLDYITWRRLTGRLEITIRKDVLAGRQFAEFALAHGWLEGNPFVGVEVPSDRDSINELVLTREEVEQYLQAADRHHALGDLARLMLHLGLRPNCEGLQIRIEDVDLDNGMLRIRDSKSRAGRRALRLTKQTRQILSRRIARAPGPWLFPGRVRVAGSRYREVDDRPLTYSALVGAHERTLKAVPDIPDFTIYSLRHTFATWFYDKTKDLVALKEVLGHSNLRTVLRYVNDSQARMNSAIELFEEEVSKQPILKSGRKAESGGKAPASSKRAIEPTTHPVARQNGGRS